MDMKLTRGLWIVSFTLVAAIAFIAGGAGKAEAASPRWRIKKTFLGVGESRNFIANSTEKTLISVPGAEGPVVLSPNGECVMTGKIAGSGAKKPGTKKEVAMACTNTTVANPPSFCSVNSPGQPVGTITLSGMKSVLVWLTKEGNSAADLFSSEAGKPLGELVITGGSCKKNGTYKIENGLLGPVLPVNEETNVATQNFPEAPVLKWWTDAGVEQTITQLTVNGVSSAFKSNFSFSLSPAEEVGIFPG